MATVCFYFQVHQPHRIRKFTIFDSDNNYFAREANAEICRKVALKCYLPANRLILDMVRRHEGKFRVSYSISGTALDQFEEFCPDVLDTFRDLAATGCVEFLAETYYHSLSFLYSREEFVKQVTLHREKIRELFGQEPTVFRNTELIYNNDVANLVRQMRFKAILAEGCDHLLNGRSPAFPYRVPKCVGIKVLLKNYRLSDDMAFRFGNRDWEEWPLTTEKFAAWVNAINGCGYLVNLFMDYETFGEHQWEDTGIFHFLEALPDAVTAYPDNDFATVSECADRFPATDDYDAPHLTSWADIERDLSAWIGNDIQNSALHELYQMEQAVKACGDPVILRDWRMMTTSDHFYYMCTKWFADGDVHKYFNPYASPHDAYINFMNVLDHLGGRIGYDR